MTLLYFIALLPIFFWIFFGANSKRITYLEALTASAVGLIFCLGFYGITLNSLTGDYETWSGKVTEAKFEPSYTRWYMQMHTRTVGSGKDAHTEIYYTRETERVPDRWKCNSNLHGWMSVSKHTYDKMVHLFGGTEEFKGMKDNYDSGNPWTYVARASKTGYVWPSVDTRSWKNTIKASPSLFSFTPVPEGIELYEYKYTSGIGPSSRLYGTASSTVDILKWDQMNSYLGPRSKINLIAIGFGDKDSSYGQYQQAHWLNGKKNDIVICFGGPNDHPTWCFVFGWTEEEIFKHNIESIVINSGFNNNILPLIQENVVKNYKLKDFTKFDYITIEPPTWYYVIFTVIMAITHCSMIFFFTNNDIDKEDTNGSKRIRNITTRTRSYL